MRDPGLNAALEAAGGVSRLARLLLISQPSVSGWSRIPASRVIQVETLTGINRRVLRPDLYHVPEYVQVKSDRLTGSGHPNRQL